MRHTINIYGRLLRVQIRSQLQYPVQFWLDLIATAFIFFFEFGSVALVLQRFGDIQGWSLGEIAFLYSIVEIAFGLMRALFGGFDPKDFGQDIRKGTFDQLLLRPINITIQVLGLRFGLRRFGKVFFGIMLFILALRLTDIDWTVGKLLYLPFVIVSITLFFGGLFIAGSTITFWTVDSIEVVNIITYGGGYVMSYPINIFQNGVRRFFTYILPAIFLNYYPALYFLDKPDPFGFPSFAPFLSPLAGIVVLLVSLAFWRFGIKHYQSTGT
ncbi:MAG: ABC transporter permease [Chloroflexi bacterium]|nr:ABC transporter permease [Chloroflexota bacterium]